MKIKGAQKKASDNAEARMAPTCRRGTPHPRCFAKRVRKLLKTNEANVEKSAKREKESARV